MYGIEIFTGEPNRPYKVVGEVYCKGNDYSDVDDIQMGLIEEATKLGANAIINVTYERKMTLFSWNALQGNATAVVIESDTKTCPSCAEEIKRSAVKCRFCGDAV